MVFGKKFRRGLKKTPKVLKNVAKSTAKGSVNLVKHTGKMFAGAVANEVSKEGAKRVTARVFKKKT